MMVTLRTTAFVGVLLGIGMIPCSLSRADVGDCSPNNVVQIGRIPDIIFPAGRASCVAIPAYMIKTKGIADTSIGNCGICPRVPAGEEHVGVAYGGASKLVCTPSLFSGTTSEISSVTTGVEMVRALNEGFTIFSDGTPGSGTIQIVARDGEMTHVSCGYDNPLAYVIGTINYFVTSGVSDTAFTHVVSPGNSPLPSHSIMTHPLLDGQPNAQPLVTSVWNYGSNPSVYNNHQVAAIYGIDVASHWSLVNLDGAAFQSSAQFNVEAAPGTSPAAYSSPQPNGFVTGFSTPSIVDHDSQALLFPTQLNDLDPNPLYTYYSSSNASWFLGNANGAGMNANGRFDIRFIGAPDPANFVLTVQADAGHTMSDFVLLDNSVGLNNLSRVFAAQTLAPGNPIVPAPLGVWFTGSQWSVFRQDTQTMSLGSAYNVYWHRPAIIAAPTPGDLDGDRRADVLLLGGSLTTMPTATSVGNGTFGTPTNATDPNFFWWVNVSGVKAVVGDFDGDGRSDAALTGGSGWNTIPVAFSRSDGTFRVTNFGTSGDDDFSQPHTPVTSTSPPLAVTYEDENFPMYASESNVRAVSGDYTGDGLADIALLGARTTVPVAVSRGDGTFTALNHAITSGYVFAPNDAMSHPEAQIVPGDFDGDGRSDIALTGVAVWNTIPVMFSNGDGTFRGTNDAVASFPAVAADSGAIALSGDFDGDGKADIAIVGDSSCAVTIAFSNGDGSFHVGSSGYSDLVCMYADHPSVKSFAGDFNGDGRTDFGLVGSFYGLSGQYRQLLVGLSNGNGTFSYSVSVVDAQQTGDLISLAATSGAAVLSASQGGPNLRNIARGMPATQSPTAFGGDPGRAVDGNPDGNWGDGSVTHTDYLSQPWWQVDLGANRYVKYIDVFNRTDCCADRLTNFQILTSLADGTTTTVTGFTGTDGRPSSFTIDAQARYVKIQLMGTNYLSLAEVYVWGR